MLQVEELRRQAREVPRAALSAVTSALWRAYADGHVTEADAETLSRVIAERQASRDPRTEPRAGDPALLADAGPVRRYGSRPRTDASLERRRRCAAAGRLPPALAARFTLAEQAVLSLVAAETTRRGDCRLHLDHLAALAGVGRTTVKNAIREARSLGLLTVEERRVTGFKNDSNIVRIVSPEWLAWVRLKRRPMTEGVGVKRATGTDTEVLGLGKTGSTAPVQGALRGGESRLRQGHAGIPPRSRTRF